MTMQELKEQIRRTERSLTQLKRRLYNTPKRGIRTQQERIKKIWLAPSALASLRAKLPEDPVAWQRSVRAQWDRRARV